jgi:hypothetical protein
MCKQETGITPKPSAFQLWRKLIWIFLIKY